MEFKIISKTITNPEINKVYLLPDQWNDYRFVTMFSMVFCDEHGVQHNFGSVKIGFKGQTTDKSTFSSLPKIFTQLDDNYFSLGQDTEYYRQLIILPNQIAKKILSPLRDIALFPDIIENVINEDVLSVSLLRDISLSSIKGQFARILDGKAELTNFKFKFTRTKTNEMSGIKLDFNVNACSTPSTNIHAVIGRNGSGKTTLLNDMIKAITEKNKMNVQFHDTDDWKDTPIQNDYFSSLVSISFSAFDSFQPPSEQPDPAKGTCYFYIGLKKQTESLKEWSDIQEDFSLDLEACMSQPNKKKRWLTAIDILESDENFANMQLKNLPSHSTENLIKKMSSGHLIVLLTITSLISKVEEKTLVLIDEPESHLHPPLLSAFIRALSGLLYDRNGVAIIATHSPVVLQEIPKNCVWKIHRVGEQVNINRPDIETFGENVGVITKEIFGLEVVRSGFHSLLVNSVKTGRSYQEIINDYNDQLGFEGRAILKVLTTDRDRSNAHDPLG
ncbi:AAA family ATPase [Piscirickettsia salmonis]|uniref:AAA family ATPase n=1 Tax=Piscirickettsia salmonis TaxID=1238 RepID=UPI003EBC5F02